MQVTLSKLASKYKEFNINQHVYVKLTDKGIDILKNRRKEFNKSLISKGIEPITGKLTKTDEDGYSKFQLWELIEIFGPYMTLCSELPFKTTIRFNKEDLASI